jgi:D-alanine-D-alanine ligase
MFTAQLPEGLSEILRLGRATSKASAVVVVANVKEVQEPNDITDVRTEYLTETELSDIVSGFRKAGFHTTAFIDEFDFLRWLLNDEWLHTDPTKYAVYSIAQRGHGPGRHALVPAAAALKGMHVLTSEPYFSCLSHHKYHAYSLLRNAGLPVPPTWLFDAKTGWLNNSVPTTGLRIIAKPNLESSSIGIGNDAVFEIKDESTGRLMELAVKLDQPILVQEFVSGWEVETPVLMGGISLPLMPVGISLDERGAMGDRFLDYETVYNDSYRFFDYMEIDSEGAIAVGGLAVRAVQALGLVGIARIDFRISPDGNAFITDITSKPHLTRHSSIAARFNMLGLDYSDIFAAMVGLYGLQI